MTDLITEGGITMVEAVNEALHEEMDRDPTVVVHG